VVRKHKSEKRADRVPRGQNSKSESWSYNNRRLESCMQHQLRPRYNLNRTWHVHHHAFLGYGLAKEVGHGKFVVLHSHLPLADIQTSPLFRPRHTSDRLTVLNTRPRLTGRHEANMMNVSWSPAQRLRGACFTRSQHEQGMLSWHQNFLRQIQICLSIGQQLQQNTGNTALN
jgi:hypothetical protein